MDKSWRTKECETIQSYFSYYTVPQAALLWCECPPDQLEEELNIAKPVSNTNEYLRYVLRHPYIPCLEPKCRIIQNAIDNGQLEAGRDGLSVIPIDGENTHIAYQRRTIERKHLKEWIAREFPSDKPKFLFDEIEQKTHTAINADAFRALQADRDALETRIKKAEQWAKEVIAEKNTLLGEIESLRATLNKMSAPGERAETTYLNIIGAMLGLMLDKSPAGNSYSVFDNQSAIISVLLAQNTNTPGISKRTLEEKFAAAKQNLTAS